MCINLKWSCHILFEKLCDQLIETTEKGGTPDWSQLPPSLQVTEESVGNMTLNFN